MEVAGRPVVSWLLPVDQYSSDAYLAGPSQLTTGARELMR